MAKSFAMNGKTMVLDRGRYKESGNVGSVNEKKGPGFLQTAKAMVSSAGAGARMAVKQGVQMGKAVGATMKANANLKREKDRAVKMDTARKVKSLGGAATNQEVGRIVKQARAAGPVGGVGAAVGNAIRDRAKTMADIEKQYK